MANVVSNLVEQARLTSQALIEFGHSLFEPTIRLGVTGLSRAGKTVFITALVHGLLRGGRFPVFEAMASGRIVRARLSPQPDDTVPRFAYEAHLEHLLAERHWPESTRQISELRLIIEYQSQNGAMRELTLDIVDYPGEWLLDLPLLRQTYEDWSSETIRLSRQGDRAHLAAEWHSDLAHLDPQAGAEDLVAQAAARHFTDYLRNCRNERFALSLLPPGRFLMPGELADSPALTFAPLDRLEGSPRSGSLWAMMRRRYESYKDAVVRPFYRNHIARLDRQIVLVDTLTALNAGPDAVHDLERALAAILDSFNIGRNSIISALFAPRIDRILFAATKADLLHHSSHDRLERILARLVSDAVERADFSGARVDAIALASVRATTEAHVGGAHGALPAIMGVPVAGERAGGRSFDGRAEIVIYPGDLPDDPDVIFATGASGFRGLSSASSEDSDYRFLRFRPPALERTDAGVPALPHIRLDRALEFLIGDRLK
ncbi:MAG: YcjX family protein [Pseudorhodoplanes sp.]|uniref:YcjX family protein n=1 Tax=Pseudorhodoplanes sp. TaxID=1934341 RepID=UPI003D128C26